MEDNVVSEDLSHTAPALLFPGKTRVLVAGVFDGHGGHQVADFMADTFVYCLLETMAAQQAADVARPLDMGHALLRTCTTLEEVSSAGAQSTTPALAPICVCVCVCERERERERNPKPYPPTHPPASESSMLACPPHASHLALTPCAPCAPRAPPHAVPAVARP